MPSLQRASSAPMWTPQFGVLFGLRAPSQDRFTSQPCSQSATLGHYAVAHRLAFVNDPSAAACFYRALTLGCAQFPVSRFYLQQRFGPLANAGSNQTFMEEETTTSSCLDSRNLHMRRQLRAHVSLSDPGGPAQLTSRHSVGETTRVCRLTCSSLGRSSAKQASRSSKPVFSCIILLWRDTNVSSS